MSKQIDGRIAYADLLRVVATLGVILIHCSGGWLEASAIGSTNWHILNGMDGLARWCVPLFVMLSGMFFLDPKRRVTLPSLFFKSIFRVAVALLVWGTAYAVWNRWPGVEGLSLPWFWATVKSVLLADTHYHLWFLYMIIGLYLITPILRAFIKGASRSDLHYFLAITFVLASLLPTLLALRPNATVTAYLWRMLLMPPLGYVGFFVAGYYLKTYTLGRIAELVIYALGILGAVVTVWGTFLLSRQRGALDTTLYEYLSPNVALMAVAVFVLFRYLISLSEERSRRQRFGSLAGVTFGIYLVHDFFLMAARSLGLLQPTISPAIVVPLQVLAIFLCSFIVVFPLSKIPFVGKYLT